MDTMTPPPRLVLELGSYFGYSALQFARRLRQSNSTSGPAWRLVSIDNDIRALRRTEQLLTHAGVMDRSILIHGTLVRRLLRVTFVLY